MKVLWHGTPSNKHFNVRALSRKVKCGCSVQRIRTNIKNLIASKRATIRCSGVASPKICRGRKIFEGLKMFDFRRITLLCLEKRLSKQKMSIFSKNLGRAWLLCPPGYAYDTLLDLHRSRKRYVCFTIRPQS